MNKNVRFSLLSLIALFSTLSSHVCLAQSYVVSVDEARLLFQEATSVEPFKDSIFVVMRDNDSLGYVVKTEPYSQSFRGYNGPVPSIIGFSPKWIVESVAPLDNQETPRFFQSVCEAGLFKSWDGLSISEAREKPVDAVSGATYTSLAAAKSVRSRLARLDDLGYGRVDDESCLSLLALCGMALSILAVVVFLKRKRH